MKYSLYKELLDDNNILSHVFFNCAEEFIEKIASKNEGKTDEKIKNRKIDIELKIDGNKCDPSKFFNMLYEQYCFHIEREAKKIVKEKISDKFNEISNKLDEYRQITEEWSDDINWDVKNPLTKNDITFTVQSIKEKLENIHPEIKEGFNVKHPPIYNDIKEWYNELNNM